VRRLVTPEAIAVPGLAAKPVIDVVAGMDDFDAARSALPRLLDLGYRHSPHRPGIAHHLDRPGRPSFGLHLTEPGSDLWRERLAFRDSLRADPALAAPYAALKARLAREHPTDLAAYMAGKRAFVAGVLAQHGVAPGRR
jgi:GrpB-like predicted nucleotidyltransferase (UPF0157 family)